MLVSEGVEWKKTLKETIRVWFCFLSLNSVYLFFLYWSIVD